MSGLEHAASVALVLAVVLGIPPHDAEPRRPRAGDLFVANLQRSDVAWFDGASGAYLGPFVEAGSGGLSAATGVAFGPGGDLYVASSANHRVLRYDGVSGDFKGVFVDGGELEQPFSLAFGPDDDLFVSSGSRNRVLRFDGATGELLGVAAEGSGLVQPIGLAFGPSDGLLYVVNSVGDNVVRFDPETGGSAGVFATDSLHFPSDLAFGADGDLYVTNAATGSVVRFDGRTGAFLDVRFRLPGSGAAAMGIASLREGTLVVGDFARDRLYAAESGGQTLRLLAEKGLDGPENIAVRP